MTDGEIAEMVLNQDDHGESDNDDIVITAVKVSIEEMGERYDELIEGLAACICNSKK